MFVSVDINNRSLKTKLGVLQKKIERYGKHNIEKRENLHITLNFLGNVSVKEEELIKSKLENIDNKRFNIILKGLGVFPSEEFIKVIWVGCKSKGLYELEESINDVLPKKYRSNGSFVPHVTISRLKNISKMEKNRLIEFINGQKSKKFGTLNVTNFNLKRSDLKKDGAIHTVEKVYDLT